MNNRELEQLEKNSTYMMRVSPEIKDKVVSENLNELCRVVKREIKKSELVVIVMKIN